MPISRRNFLRSGTISVLSAGLVLKSGVLAFGQGTKRSNLSQITRTAAGDYQVPAEAAQNPIIYYKRTTFEPYVGGTFTSRDARGRAIPMTLVSVTGYAPSRATRIMMANPRTSDSFTLLFRAPRELPPFTTIYVVEHPVLGKFDLFLKRAGADGQVFYEAVINHIV
jgi:hypothetical protein